MRRNIYKFSSALPVLAAAMALSGCYTDFTPDFDEAPVLYMNSLLTSGEPVEVFVGRTYRFDDNDSEGRGECLADAEVILYADGREVERLAYCPPEETDDIGMYKGSYIPASGQTILLKAIHREWGEAEAEVIMPCEVEVEDITKDFGFSLLYTYDPAEDGLEGESAVFGFPYLRMEVDFTDPQGVGNCYTLGAGIIDVEGSNEDEFTRWGSYSADYSDALFSEHLSPLEKVMEYDNWGCSFFTDRQIDGKTHKVRIGLDNGYFMMTNPIDQPASYDMNVRVMFAHISPAYYNFLLSRWKYTDGFTGQLGSIGLAEEVRTFSNVSTGSGIVAARTVDEITIPLSDDLKRCLREAGIE